MNWLLNRLKEPSSAAGVAAIVQSVAGAASGTMGLEMVLTSLLAGIYAVFRPEAKS